MSIIRKLSRFRPFFARRVASKEKVDVGAMVGMPHGFSPANPSFIDVPKGRLICVRGVNYELANDISMRPIFKVGNSYQSVNRFILIRPNGIVEPLHALDAAVGSGEDVRLCSHNQQVWATFSAPLNESGQRQRCGICVARIAQDLQSMEIQPLASPYGLAQEKNWSPFSYDEALHLVYSFEPLVIVRLNESTGTIGFVDPSSADLLPSTFSFLLSGSSAGLPVRERQLFILHRRKVRLPSGRRSYVHRCAMLNPATWSLSFDRYFTIDCDEIQFVGGAVRSGREISLSYGRMDRSAWTAVFSLSDLAPHLALA